VMTDRNPDQKRIGKYDVVEKLGSGGMGVVYRAVDKQLGREVAIKTLTQGIAGHPDMLARFYEEGRKMGRLNHPHIVTIYDLGEDNGIPYIVMERVKGESLDTLIRAQNLLPMIDRIRIMEEVCSALGCAHSNNVIHRDVKPANIFVQPDGKAKLIDFGIARHEKRGQELSLTREDHIIGTIPYIAPERLKGRTIDGRSDIFSAGVVLYQLISGQLPFSGEDYVLMQKIMSEPHPPLANVCRNYPPGVDAIIDKALAKSPDDRYQTAEEMAGDLNSIVEELRHEQMVELIPRAKRLLEDQDLTRALVIVQQALKVDSKNTGARELRSEIRRRLSERQRDEKLAELRQIAEEALSQDEFDRSLSLVEEGLLIDPGNADFLELRDHVQAENKKHQQIEELLRQADAARRKGDYVAAMASANEALKVDRTNSRIVTFCNSLRAEAEEAERRTQAKALLLQARRQLESRQYEKALDLLQQVTELDPSEPEAELLKRDARSGLDKLRRRDLIARLEEDASRASTLEQFKLCAKSIEQAMATMHAEPSLIRLKAHVDRRVKDLENNRLVEDTVRACPDLRPRDALEVVRQALQRLPGDARLLSLEARLLDRIQLQSADERRDEYLSKAREALNASQSADAAQILESCKADGLADEEVLRLLEFVKEEVVEQQRQMLKRENLEKAQALLHRGAIEEAILFLEKSLSETGDPAFQLLLDQATRTQQAAQRKVDTALASAGELIRARGTEEAIRFLKEQPVDVARSPRIKLSIAMLEDELNRSLFRMTGRAYATLGTDLVASHAIMERVKAASGDNTNTAGLGVAFRSREEASADRFLNETAGKAQSLLRNHDRSTAESLVRQAEEIALLASQKGKSDWKNQANQLSKIGIFGRNRS
jgi:eukaryotic-like serine/threonine-protein kinase